MSLLYLNIGSNSGDRRAFIARAVAALPSAFGNEFAGMRLSEDVESDPWGFESASRFINVGVEIVLKHRGPWRPDALEGLLSAVKDIEKSLSDVPHRHPDGTYADREIDIDIIALDDVCYSSPTLSLPHLHMAQRMFVLKPMAELAPDWRHPLTQLTPQQMLARL